MAAPLASKSTMQVEERPSTTREADGSPTPDCITTSQPPSTDPWTPLPTTTTRPDAEPFANGYHFPPAYPLHIQMRHGLQAFWRLLRTPMGFLWTVYGLNVVAWGGMLFLILCNAAPAMCQPDCNDIDSPRRKWVEWDSQILNGLFCVTGLGLAPWRFRDLYHLLQYRCLGCHEGLRTLAGIHRGWFRLPGSHDLPVEMGPSNLPPPGIDAAVFEDALPLPREKMPDRPLSGTRAPPTKAWTLDLIIWAMVVNTLTQCALSGVMWGLNRYRRPSWATGFLVAFACLVAMAGGLGMWREAREVKRIEGVPCTAEDLEVLARDKKMGIPHNRLGDMPP